MGVPPPPPRVPKAVRDEKGAAYTKDQLMQIEMTAQVFQDVHAQISPSSGFQSIVQRLMAICQQIENSSFLALEEVVLGGAAGKGLLTSGPQAEIVLFVRQLPFRNFSQWLPHILETLSPVLECQLANHKAEKFKVEKDRLSFQIRDSSGKDSVVHVYLSPVFKDRADLLECIKNTPPADRSYLYPAMAKDRNELVGRQPQQIKALIRLMTWWASKQSWSSSIAAPSDWLMELIVISTFPRQNCSNFNLATAVFTVMKRLATFESAKVHWSEAGVARYQEQDIWKPLLSHEPLFMDPLNPYCDLADANMFDSHEMVAAARQEDSLMCFRREAAPFLLGSSAGDGDGDDQDEGGA